MTVDPRVIKAAVLAEEARRSGRRDFATFVKQAWHLVDAAPLIWNKHLDALCIHLEAVARSEILRLVINIPPGHAKSLIVSVLWPAWMWTHRPSWQVIASSYGADLAKRDANKARDLILSDWYQETYVRDEWALSDSQNTKDLYENTAHGHRFSCGVDNATGMRADCVILDDPLKAQESHSRAHREQAERFLSTASTRFNEAQKGAIVIIMQRLRENDTTGYVLAGGGYEHCCMPAEFEVHRRSITYHVVDGDRREMWRDWREAEGELLFPEKFPKSVLQVLKRPNELGEFGYAGQIQQRPAPAEGGLFRLADWRFWKPDATTRERLNYVDAAVRPRGCYTGEATPLALGDLEEELLSVDPTFRETKSGSYVAIHVWGRIGARRPLLYRVKRRMDFTETVKEILKAIELFPNARRKLIEGKANGDAIISTLEKNHGVIGLEPVSVSDSKEQRANAMQPYVTGHNVELPEGAPWVEDYIQIHAAFPNGAEDDDVDAQSQGLQGFERRRTWADEWSESHDDDPFD